MLVNRAWHDSNGLFKEYVLQVGISCCVVRVVVLGLCCSDLLYNNGLPW